MKITTGPTGPTSRQAEAGFTLLELVMVCAILTIVLGAVFNGMDQVTKRSQVEQTKVDLTQAGREFVDEFERDVHQAGYPNCRMVATAGVVSSCPSDPVTNLFLDPVRTNPAVAVGLVHVDSTQVVFEGDVDGSGVVSTVKYQLVDSAGIPVSQSTGTCPCKVQRSQVRKGQNDTFSLELENVVNSGQSTTAGVYSGGLTIDGSTTWGETNDAYYAAVSAFKDFPVFQAYDQQGLIVPLPQDLLVSGNRLNCQATYTNCIKTIRLTINLLANGLTGVDLQNGTRPVTTLVGDARLVNN